jgi:DNA replication protein DnaC
MTQPNNHASNCVLAGRCKLANSTACNRNCGSFIAMMGHSGKGGRIANANTPADYRLLTLANSPAREGQAKVYATLEKYVATFERQFDENAPRIKSLYLWSESPGNGKTTSAISVMNEYIIANYLGALKRGRQALQTPAYFLDVNRWQTDFNLAVMTNDEHDMDGFKREMRKVMNVPFAVLDDIGVRDCSPKFRGYIHAVINHRTVNGYPTIFTSNLPLEEMKTVFDHRLYDRMNDQCHIEHFSGTSHRGKRKGK